MRLALSQGMFNTQFINASLVAALMTFGMAAAHATPKRQAADVPKTALRNQHVASPSATLLGAAIKLRAKKTGHTSGKIKFPLSAFASASDAELRAMETDFARAGIFLDGPRYITHFDGSGAPQIAWFFRALSDVRAKPHAPTPSAKTVFRLGKQARARAYADI